MGGTIIPGIVQVKASPCRELAVEYLLESTKVWSWRPLPLALVQEGGGEEEGLTTGAKADLCLTAADTMFAGEKEKTPEEDELLDGSEVEDAIVGLDGTMA